MIKVGDVYNYREAFYHKRGCKLEILKINNVNIVYKYSNVSGDIIDTADIENFIAFIVRHCKLSTNSARRKKLKKL